jgi:hypothetical protein
MPQTPNLIKETLTAVFGVQYFEFGLSFPLDGNPSSIKKDPGQARMTDLMHRSLLLSF